MSNDKKIAEALQVAFAGDVYVIKNNIYDALRHRGLEGNFFITTSEKGNGLVDVCLCLHKPVSVINDAMVVLKKAGFVITHNIENRLTVRGETLGEQLNRRKENEDTRKTQQKLEKLGYRVRVETTYRLYLVDGLHLTHTIGVFPEEDEAWKEAETHSRHLDNMQPITIETKEDT